MKIDRDEARRIATLAHLEFDDAGLDRMAAEMTKILGYVEQLPECSDALQRVDGGLKPAAPPLRDDAMKPSVDRDVVARNAPEWEDGFFVVPPVIE